MKAHLPSLLIVLLFSLAAAQLLPLPINGDSRRQTYIVHVKPPQSLNLHSHEDKQRWYHSFLPSPTAAAATTNSGEPRMVFTYRHAISGFAARLTAGELKAMQKSDGFLHAHVDHLIPLHTTHAADFIGLARSSCLIRDTAAGKGMIVGVLDTGIHPSHPSFRDDGMPHPPTRWKGHCDFKPALCNNKLIGAKSFSSVAAKGAPFDVVGHGTLTASIAAGGLVENAHVLGSAHGAASGVAPSAHLAVYKVCHNGLGCLSSDVLAGIDQAIADGVDVISLSLGGKSLPFYDDSVAVGAMAAAELGIFVSCSAGNSGPASATVENAAPWVLTVGASTTDRRLQATVRLGNGEELVGESAYQVAGFTPVLLPIVYPGERAGSRAKTCSDGSLSRINVQGKVVLCRTGGANSSVEKGAVVKAAGGVAMVLMNERKQGYTPAAGAHVLPASHISHADGSKLVSYIKSSSNPTATIDFIGTLYGSSQSPAVASFSSRGPSRVNEGILKPDIVGPGVDVVGAWPFPVGPAILSNTNTNTTTLAGFNIISGTSMSAPLLAGVAALLKTSHPNWSPAAIKSAIMTTADTLDADGSPITDETSNATGHFAVGAGHVHPSRANDPGLVYDIEPEDYVRYLCGLGYTDGEVSAVARRAVVCSSVDAITAEELNYPSISVTMGAAREKTITRTVKNVGGGGEVYRVQVRAPEGVKVSVYPDQLRFSETKKKVSYNVYFSAAGGGGRRGGVSEGQLRWVSSNHVVRSPVVVTYV